jgi:energy-coupling factor transporter ATP-binding protein EcfA2
MRAISSVEVRGLFGTYDYSLRPPGQDYDVDRLWILYGDNGCGKTTILKTLFHLLAPDSGEGHKTAVAGIPFGRFEVSFTSGEQVWAERASGRTSGTFKMGVKLKGKKQITYTYVANEDGKVLSTSPEDEVEQVQFLSALRRLDLGLFFLSDDRTVRLAGQTVGDFSTPAYYVDEEHILRARMRRSSPWIDPEELERRVTGLLVESIRRAEWWIQAQAVHGSSEGESSVNTLYAEILKRVSRLPLDEKRDSESSVAEVERMIGSLEKRSRTFAQYGLLPEFNGRDIISVVKSAPATHWHIMTNVVKPYVESVDKKLDAMETLQRQLDALVTTLNSFFTHKTVSFDLRNGFHITADSGRELAPNMLSSGERHLLLLFLNTVLALDRPSVFIIDEPEISLNIKWQRRLLASLLQCAGDSAVQYLFATHSIELLSQHRDNTIRVVEKAD